MDVTKEIKDRLQTISKLFKEIEDIILRKSKIYDSKFQNDQSYVCVCGQKSSREIQSNGVKDNNGKNIKTTKQLNIVCSEKHVKCEELDKKAVSSEIKDIGPCSWKSYKQNRGKINLDKDDRLSCVLCCEASDKHNDRSAQNDCTDDQYKHKLNDFKRMFMSYFENVNKD